MQRGCCNTLPDYQRSTQHLVQLADEAHHRQLQQLQQPQGYQTTATSPARQPAILRDHSSAASLTALEITHTGHAKHLHAIQHSSNSSTSELLQQAAR